MNRISLEESKKIKIFNRFESKYIIDHDDILNIIRLLENDYLLVEENNKIIFGYHSLYFDTPELNMWNDHNIDKPSRQKIRIREYDDKSKFLEIKEKIDGKTIKTRIPIESYFINDEEQWISDNLKYDTKNLIKSLDVKYNRISFVKKDKTERITLDIDIEYYNYKTNKRWKSNKNFAILEIKKNKEENNEIEDIINKEYIFKQKYSKYYWGILKTK